VLLLNKWLLLLFISLSTQFGNFWIYPRVWWCRTVVRNNLIPETGHERENAYCTLRWWLFSEPKFILFGNRFKIWSHFYVKAGKYPTIKTFLYTYSLQFWGPLVGQGRKESNICLRNVVKHRSRARVPQRGCHLLGYFYIGTYLLIYTAKNAGVNELSELPSIYDHCYYESRHMKDSFSFLREIYLLMQIIY
jgi:hypothetical protein